MTMDLDQDTQDIKFRRNRKRKRNMAAKALERGEFRQKVIHPKKLEKPKKVTLRNYEDIDES